MNANDLMNCFKMTVDMNGIKKFEEYISKLEKENAELKKQLEDMTDCRDIASGHRKEVQDRETILLKQQQEFIKYLEDEANKWHYNFDNIDFEQEIEEPSIEEILNEVEQKYKEIIGEK